MMNKGWPLGYFVKHIIFDSKKYFKIRGQNF